MTIEEAEADWLATRNADIAAWIAVEAAYVIYLDIANAAVSASKKAEVAANIYESLRKSLKEISK